MSANLSKNTIMFQHLDIILASGSPRRKKLLEEAELSFTVKTSDVEETYPDSLLKMMIPEFLAAKKAEAVRKEYANDKLIIAADTIVLQDSKVLGKPKDREDAIFKLKSLSGAVHQVITGVCLCYQGEKKTFSASTNVFFKRLSKEIITHYVDQYHPLDKAGAYGIQEWIGLVGIDRIEGDYFNVVGLPVSRVLTEMFRIVK